MTPKEAYNKCYNENCRIFELENIIAKDPYWSYRYARNIIQGSFLEGEKIIATDGDWSYHYARFVVKNAFPLCHSIIFNCEYRKNYINFLKSINYDLKEIEEWLI